MHTQAVFAGILQDSGREYTLLTILFCSNNKNMWEKDRQLSSLHVHRWPICCDAVGVSITPNGPGMSNVD